MHFNDSAMCERVKEKEKSFFLLSLWAIILHSSSQYVLTVLEMFQAGWEMDNQQNVQVDEM